MSKAYQVDVRQVPEAFIKAVRSLQEDDYKCEFVVKHYRITHIRLTRAFKGKWDDVEFGKIILAGDMGFIEQVLKPAIVDGKLVLNHDEE